jgi:hypothetical protein
VKISEYINSEQAKMKDKPFKERFAYFWDYYKWYVLIGAFFLVLIGQTVVTKINQKEAVLNGILIDGSAPLEPPSIVQEFCEINGIDTQKQEIVLDTGVALDSSMPEVVSNSYQVIYARIGARDVDFVMGFEYAIQRLAYDPSHMFTDLRQLLSAEALASLEGKIYYIDGAVLQKIKENPTAAIPLPEDPFAPELMEDPIPIAVDMTGCTEFSSVYYSPSRKVYISVVTNSPNQELATRFIEFLLS